MANGPQLFRNGKLNQFRLDAAEPLTVDAWGALGLTHFSFDPPSAAAAGPTPQHAPPTQGTIAFTGFNADDPDSIAFVALDDIAAGTVITLDDNEWSGSAFNTGEGTLVVTLTAGVTAGTVVVIEGAQLAPTISTGTVSRTGNFNVAGGTDAIYAYTGTTAAPNFLSAIANEGFTGATTTGLLTNTNLTVGINAIDLGTVDAGADIGAYNGARTGQTSFAAYAAIINNASNWITQDASASQAADGTPPDLPFSAVAFTIAGPGTLSVGNVTLAEGNSGPTTFSFTVSRTGGTAGAVTADYTISAPGGAGIADSGDFVAGSSFSGQVSFADGETVKSITIDVQGDTTFEDSETFTVTLSNPGGGAMIGTAGTGTITNDDPAPAGTLSINDVTLAEGNSGPTTFSFTVSRTGGSGGAVTADYTISAPGGAGIANSADFVAGAVFSGQVSFADGETSKSITIDVQGDTTFEANETFTVTLSNATGGASIGDASGTGTITNDDPAPPPSASIGDVSIVESDSGNPNLVFTVTLSSAPTGPVTIDFATADGTATGGSDYVNTSGQVNFIAGQTTQTISIPIFGDTVAELQETFTITLSNPSGATLGDAVATGTITDNDGPLYFALSSGNFSQNWTDIGLITTDDNWNAVPHIIGYRGDDVTGSTGVNPQTLTGSSTVVDVNANQSNPDTFGSGGVAEFHIANPTVALNGSGTADAPYIVLHLDTTGRQNVTVNYRLRDLDASADDAAMQVALQYRVGATGPWIDVPAGYVEDATGAGTATLETLVSAVLPVGAENQAQLQVRIITANAAGNDEWVGIDDITVTSILGPPTLSIADASVIEGNSGLTEINFTVTRIGDTSGEVSANYFVTGGGNAFQANGADFDPATEFFGTVTFADGQTSQTITFNVQGDTDPEASETFTVTLTDPVGGVIQDGEATGTIVNDDGAPPVVSINDVTVTEGNGGTSLMTFTLTRTGGTGAFTVDYATVDGTAVAGEDYVGTSGIVGFAAGQMTRTISVTINGDTESELSETLRLQLFNASDFALIADDVGIGTIATDDPLFIHDIQGSGYFSPILLAESITTFNTASAGAVTVRAIITAVDNDGPRQGFYITEEVADWDSNTLTSEGIFVMTRNDAGVGSAVSGVAVGDNVTVMAQVMEYQAFSTMPRTMLVNPSSIVVNSTGNALPPPVVLIGMPNDVLTNVTPDYILSSDFDATSALGYFETVEGMLVTIPNMVVADGFVSTSGGRPFLQAYSLDSANPDQINSRGGYTIAGDPPVGPPDTAETGDDTEYGGRHLHDGDVNPDIVELDFTGWAMTPPTGLTQNATMGDQLGDVTGIIDFDFTDRKLFVTAMEPGGFVNGGVPVQETTALGNDGRSLTVATFNVENLDPGDGAARFTALANAIANNLNAPDIISIEEMQDNNGATASGGADASTTWQMLVTALNLATGANYQWVDQEPVAGAEGGEPGGNIRVGFLYNTDRVQLGDLAANATLAERRQYTDRIGDGVRDAGDLIAFSDDMVAGEINTADWSATRRSLLGEFTFNGNTVYVTANHFTAKGGSGEFWQFDQNLENGEPENSGWAKRSEQAEDVYAMLNLIEAGSGGAGIVAGGDFNDFYFYRPLTTLTGYTLADGAARVGGARFDNLTVTELTEAERYTYTFDGRSQAIDHVIANALLSGVASYDVVHINTGYNGGGTGPDADPSLSDHDPAVASFDFRDFSEVLVGTAGNDGIAGFGGDDRIWAMGGDDVLIGGSGADTVAGGQGNDTYYVDDSGDIIEEQAGQGRDIVYASANYVLTPGQEVEILSTAAIGGTDPLQLTGNEFAQEVLGNNGANVLRGGGGDDALVGYGGDDDYYVTDGGETIHEAAGGGRDVVYASVDYVLRDGAEVEILSAVSLGGTDAIDLTGNDFANTLLGNAGDNVLNGGLGADTLVGFGGADTFAFTTSLGGGNVDFILDFVSGTDKIALEDSLFAGLTPGTLPASAFALGSAQDADDRIVYDQASGAIYYDADGNGGGAAVQFATLNAGTVLTASDFMVI